VYKRDDDNNVPFAFNEHQVESFRWLMIPRFAFVKGNNRESNDNNDYFEIIIHANYYIQERKETNDN
jgi:hypothetical protein